MEEIDMFGLDNSDDTSERHLQFDLLGHPIKRTDSIDSLRRGLFKRQGEMTKRIDTLEKRLEQLEDLISRISDP
jgi:SMC interacting uncharacterized protein involved in chromosome segregation